MSREHLKRLSDIEQSTEFISTELPKQWSRMYKNLRKEGIKRKTAMQMMKTFIMAQFLNIQK